MGHESSETATVERGAASIVQIDLQISTTIGMLCGNLEYTISQLSPEDPIYVSLTHYRDQLGEITEGHDGVTLQDFSEGKMGDNVPGTKQSRVDRDLLGYDKVMGDASCGEAEEVLDHEDDVGTGHAGQDASRLGLVIPEQLRYGDIGEAVVEDEEMLEGEVEASQGKDKRGNASASRDGQPKELYGSGQNKVAPYADVFSQYLRHGLSRIEAQKRIFRDTVLNRKLLQQTLIEARFSQNDTERILAA